MNTEAIYTALKEFVERGLAATAPGVPDTALKVEVSEAAYGEEWTGIRMSKLPTATTQKRYIDGGARVARTYQLTSKQANGYTEAEAITYSTYLEQLTGQLRSMFRSGQRPALPDGVTLLDVDAVQQATLNFADGTYSGYVLDLRFTMKLRRY